MKTLPLSECLKQIPSNAKTGVFIMIPHDTAKRFQEATVRAIRQGIKRGLRRAVLIFGKGIPEPKAKRIMSEIGQTLQEDNTLRSSWTINSTKQ